jgi:hypothetical protein
MMVWGELVKVVVATGVPLTPLPAPEAAESAKLTFMPGGMVPVILPVILRVTPGATAEVRFNHLALLVAVLLSWLPASVGATKLKEKVVLLFKSRRVIGIKVTFMLALAVVCATATFKANKIIITIFIFLSSL